MELVGALLVGIIIGVVGAVVANMVQEARYD